jgi:two-component system nitrogen regulation sensor histidine kinase NtrY
MFFARRLSEKITADKLYENARLAELRRLVEEKQREYNLGTVEIYSAESEAIVAVSDKTKRIMDLKPDGEFLARALRGVGVTWTQPLGEGDVIRGGAPIFGPQKRIVGVAVVDYHVPKSLTNRAKQISESYEQYKYLTFLKAPVKNSYILTLFLITLVIMFSATWWGFYLSKGITVPIQKLAEGTHEVAQGNWDYKIETSGDDEIGVLVQSFNQMTGDLKQITLELERRGKVVQTLLANIAAGVVSVDPAGKITTWNKAAEQMLGVKADQVLAKGYRDVLQPEPLRLVAEIIDGVQDREKIEREIKIPQQHEQQLTAVVTAATLRDDDGSALGVMVFLEDITQIQKVQRMEAWREVARRIAHEIKNPLTPIQLSAERLRKRYANLLGGDGGILDKCTTTIIQQVEELKNLVNEFSQFARLPSAKLATHDLNEIVSESLFLFNEGHKGIQFHFRPGVIPTLDLDRDQIKRVLINLLDNAVAAVRDDGEIKLATLYDRGRGVVTLEVADNGSGLAPEMRTKIFEPYFSTKENGTGLGLTIVSQIIEDHRGYIRALPNEPKGTRFSIEFPASEVAKRAAHS